MTREVAEMYVPPMGSAFLGNPDQSYAYETGVTYIRDYYQGRLGIDAGATLNRIYPDVPEDHVIWMSLRAIKQDVIIQSDRYIYDTNSMVLGLVVGPELQQVDPNVDDDLTLWVPFEDPCDPDLAAEWRFANNDLVVYPQNIEVTSFGQNVKLTAQEFKLLCFLAVNYRKVVPREDLVCEIWGPNDSDVGITSLRRVIHGLRQKTGNPSGIIQNQQGFGYRLKETEPKQ